MDFDSKDFDVDVGAALRRHVPHIPPRIVARRPVRYAADASAQTGANFPEAALSPLDALSPLYDPAPLLEPDLADLPRPPSPLAWLTPLDEPVEQAASDAPRPSPNLPYYSGP